MINHKIYYNLNILKPDSQISQEFNIRTEIFITKTDL